MKKEFPSIGSALSYGFKNAFGHNIFFFFGICFIIGLMLILLDMLTVLNQNLLPATHILWSVLVIALIVFLWIGWVIIRLEWYEKATSSIKKLFSGRQFLLPVMGAASIYVIMIACGTILFIIPGIYLATRFYFFNYLIIDKKVGILQAFKLSSALTKGHRLKLFLFILVCSLLIGTIVLIPVAGLASVFMYKKLDELHSRQEIA